MSGVAELTRTDHVAIDLHDAENFPWPDLSSAAIVTALGRYFGGCQRVSREEEIAAVGAPLVLCDDRFLYFRRLAAAETRIAHALENSLAEPSWLAGLHDDALVAAASVLPGVDEESRDIVLTVARLMASRTISLLTGGPGTGKTWTVAKALQLLNIALDPQQHLTVATSAPTAKAERRTTSSIQKDAGPLTAITHDSEQSGTLFRLLGVTPDNFERPRTPSADIIVVDEVSMADLPMLDLLLRQAAIGKVRHVVFIGDPDQLMSVTVGAVLADMVRATDSNVEILDFAAAINAADSDRVEELLTSPSSSLTYATSVESDLISVVTTHAENVVTLAENGAHDAALTTLSSLAVLCATHRGPNSVAFWNDTVATALARRGVTAAGRFHLGQSLLVTRNQPAYGVANGDVGVVVTHNEQPSLYINEDTIIPLSVLGYVEPAWALTIHKSQGSEYDHVIVCLPDESNRVLSRQLFYTGVTRAKSRLTIISSLPSIRTAISTSVPRMSGLSYRLSHH
jgi:exodeoxyribonuclease V alpha subunit